MTAEDLGKIVNQAEKDLLSSKRIKFQRSKLWREENVPEFPGVYALFENTHKLLYIGESGNLRERMADICRTVNHTFRKSLGHQKFGIVKPKGKYEPEIEKLLNDFFDETLHAAFLRVNFGRTEIESHMVTRYQKDLLNSVSKRKLKVYLDHLKDN